ncbi:hypothetical protein EVAR_87130_1 [Eumeta japonica]|uniref:Uncharacterized protein n=1 Tax=Eumeta variegata TaxID=151549 RepID=A0A4C1VWI3_EUMVA|nr:hypothetical protein EVAR_87130_1 [Eumeta japonica]
MPAAKRLGYKHLHHQLRKQKAALLLANKISKTSFVAATFPRPYEIQDLLGNAPDPRLAQRRRVEPFRCSMATKIDEEDVTSTHRVSDLQSNSVNLKRSSRYRYNDGDWIVDVIMITSVEGGRWQTSHPDLIQVSHRY